MNQAVELEKIQTKIYEIRGQKVILDRDLSYLYRVETAHLKRAVRRNKKRFPEKFMFELTKNEYENLRCQSGISSWGGARYLPYAFTEYGTLAVSSILNSNIAVEMNIKIIEAFIEMKRDIKDNPNLKLLAERVKNFESRLDSIELSQRIDSKISTDKVISLSKEVRTISELFDDFQDTHVIIKRPADFK